MSGSAGLHEPAEKLKPETIERHRAIASLIEELEAVDWYAQRADATQDEALREVLIHNMNEEKEHAAMALEWLRRHDPKLDAFLRRFLFREGPISEGADGGEEKSEGGGDLGLRDLGKIAR